MNENSKFFNELKFLIIISLGYLISIEYVVFSYCGHFSSLSILYLFFIFLVFFDFFKYNNIKERFGINFTASNILLGIFLFFILNIVLALTVSLLCALDKSIYEYVSKQVNRYYNIGEIKTGQQVVFIGFRNLFILLFPFSVVIIPIIMFFIAMFEEYLFRGVIQDIFKKSLKNVYLAIIFQGFLFGLLHIITVTGSSPEEIMIFRKIIVTELTSFGILLGIAREKFKSIIPGVFCHMMYNLVVILTYILFSF